MGVYRPVFRGRYGLSGPQPSFAHPEISDPRSQRSSVKKYKKGARIQAKGAFPLGEGRRLVEVEVEDDG